MGLFSFLPFVDDDPEPAPKPVPKRPVLRRAAAGRPSTERPAEPTPRRTESPSGTSSTPRRTLGIDAQNRGTTKRQNIAPSHNIKPEKPPVNLSDPVRQMLVDAGWDVPAPQRAARATSLDSLDMSKATELNPHEYKFTDDEWAMLQNSVGGSKGYKQGSALKAEALPAIQVQGLKAAPMTWEAYSALSDDQRKAVDFNTLLVEARQKDLADTGVDGATVVPDNYKETVDRIFGEGGGSNRIASNTVNLLDKIGLEAKGQDLDEFLSLDRAITWDELQDFKFSEGEVVGLNSERKTTRASRTTPASTTIESNFGEVRGLLNQARIDTSAIDKAGAFLEGLRADPNTKMWDFSSTAAMGLTGKRPDVSEIPFGYALPGERTGDDAKKEEVYQLAYEYLMNRGNTNLDLFWQNLNSFKYTDQDVQELFEFIDRRSRDEEGSVLDQNVRSGAELRQFAGLGG